MLSVIFIVKLSVVMLNVVMLSVAEPFIFEIIHERRIKHQVVEQSLITDTNLGLYYKTFYADLLNSALL
jgi:hypothetical protein